MPIIPIIPIRPERGYEALLPRPACPIYIYVYIYVYVYIHIYIYIYICIDLVHWCIECRKEPYKRALQKSPTKESDLVQMIAIRPECGYDVVHSCIECRLKTHPYKSKEPNKRALQKSPTKETDLVRPLMDRVSKRALRSLNHTRPCKRALQKYKRAIQKSPT